MQAGEQKGMGRGWELSLLGFVWTYVRPYRRLIFFALLLMPVNAAFALAQPYVVQLVIDIFLARNRTAPPPWLAAVFRAAGGPSLFAIGLIYVLLVVGEFSSFYGQFYLTMMAAQYSLSDLRSAVFEHVERLPMSFFDRTPVGRLVSRMTTDIEAINEMFAAGSLTLFIDVMTMSGIVLIMWSKSQRLALYSLCAIPPLALMIHFLRPRARLVYRQIRERLAALNAYLSEALSGMAVIQLFTREGLSRAEFDQLNSQSRDAQALANIYEAAVFSAVDAVSSIAIGLILWIGGGQVLHRAITLGALVGFIQYAQLFFQPLREMSNKYTVMQSALVAVERIETLMAEPPSAHPASPAIITSKRGEIVFEHVNFAYRPGEPVLNDLSFRVEPGEKVAVVGPTGAGKSTIIKLLNRFYDVGSGRILVDGVDVRDWDLGELRRTIGLVQQDVFLFSGTIEENVRLARTELSEREIRQALARAQALRFVERLPAGLNDQVHERAVNFSAGQRQLLSFARALAYDPRILVMDEATSSVDSETERLIALALDELFANRTALIIAHRLSTIERAHRIMVLSNGVLRESGTHAELLALRGLYFRLCELQYAVTTQPASLQAADD